MSLSRMPPEILLHILALLGSAFFRQDAGRLLVSKWWYQIAWPVLLRDLDFSAESLQNFVLASKREGMIDLIQDHVVTVNLGLDGFEDWHAARHDTEKSGIDLHVVDTWTFELNSSLAALASMLRRCTRLQSLKLAARPERYDPRTGLARRDYLKVLPLAGLVSIGHLTCLEIDTAGTHLLGESNTPRTYLHLCDVISTALSTLRRLRCRISTICPHILDAPENDPLLRLEDVVINLSLSEISSSDTSYRYPSRCGHIVPGNSFRRLKASMESQARELVRVMNNPRLVRIVSHTFPGLQMHSFDAITGRNMVLASAAPWDADGEEVEEVDAGEDLFDSDSSSEESL